MTATPTPTRTYEPGFDLEQVPARDRARVEAMIEDKDKVFGAYTNRYIAGNKSDFEVFDSAFRLRHNVLMVGPTGAGKTTAARAYAAWHGLPFASVEFSGGIDVAATLGGMQVDPDTGLPVWVDGEITLVVRYGGVVMLDEVNFAPPRFTAGFHGVLDSRQTLYLQDLGIRVSKSENTIIMGAYNPRYTGTNLLNEAFTNRWAYTLDPWGYDEAVEDERVGQYSPTLLGHVRNMRNDPDVQGDIGTNTMEEFIWIANDLNIEVAVSMFLGRLDPEDRAVAQRVFEADKYRIADELGCDVSDTDTTPDPAPAA